MKLMSFLLKIVASAVMLSGAALAEQDHGHGHDQHHRHCAVAEGVGHQGWNSRLVIEPNEAIEDLGDVRGHHECRDWDNRITSVTVFPGCTFVGYQYQNFNVNYHSGRNMHGFVVTLDNDNHHHPKKHYLPYYMETRLSSLKCFCR